MKKKQPAYSAFISYASDDREKADEICASLEERGLGKDDPDRLIWRVDFHVDRAGG